MASFRRRAIQGVKPRNRRRLLPPLAFTCGFTVLVLRAAYGQEFRSNSEEYFKAATCDRGVPRASGWNTGSFQAATLGCLETQGGTVIGFLNFPGNARSSANTLERLIPDGFRGILAVRFHWFTSGTNSNVKWVVNPVCSPARGAQRNPMAAHGRTITTDAPAKPNTLKVAEIVDLDSRECIAGDGLSIELVRDGTDSVDKLKAPARMMGMSLRFQ